MILVPMLMLHVSTAIPMITGLLVGMAREYDQNTIGHIIYKGLALSGITNVLPTGEDIVATSRQLPAVIAVYKKAESPL
jgi:hypothetical protein